MIAGKDEPKFFAKRLSSDKDGAKPQRYRVLIKANGAKSQVTVLNNLGVPDDSEAARQIEGRLIDDLRSFAPALDMPGARPLHLLIRPRCAA